MMRQISRRLLCHCVQFLIVASLGVTTCLADSRGTLFTSPPLTMLNNQQLHFTLPTGWKIIQCDAASNWRTSSYMLTIVPLSHKGRTFEPVTIEVLMHGLGRAKRHGDLDGIKYQTASGLQGIETILKFEPDERNWYFTVPLKATDSALIVRLIFKHMSQSRQRWLAHKIYRSVGFVRK